MKWTKRLPILSTTKQEVTMVSTVIDKSMLCEKIGKAIDIEWDPIFFSLTLCSLLMGWNLSICRRKKKFFRGKKQSLSRKLKTFFSFSIEKNEKCYKKEGKKVEDISILLKQLSIKISIIRFTKQKIIAMDFSISIWFSWRFSFQDSFRFFDDNFTSLHRVSCVLMQSKKAFNFNNLT